MKVVLPWTTARGIMRGTHETDDRRTIDYPYMRSFGAGIPREQRVLDPLIVT